MSNYLWLLSCALAVVGLLSLVSNRKWFCYLMGVMGAISVASSCIDGEDHTCKIDCATFNYESLDFYYYALIQEHK